MINLELKEALKDLISWVPEHNKSSNFSKMAGISVEQVALEDNRARFLSEAFLYAILGKEDARSLLFSLHRVCRAAGFEMYDLEQEIARESEGIKQR